MHELKQKLDGMAALHSALISDSLLYFSENKLLSTKERLSGMETIASKLVQDIQDVVTRAKQTEISLSKNRK